MTAPADRQRLAEVRARAERELQHPDGHHYSTASLLVRDVPDLIATAEWGWDEHDRAKRLAAEVERLQAEPVTVSISREVPAGSTPLSAKARVMSGLDERTTVRIATVAGAWEFRAAEFSRYASIPAAWDANTASQASLAALIADLRALHRPGTETADFLRYCFACNLLYPCPTEETLARHAGAGS